MRKTISRLSVVLFLCFGLFSIMSHAQPKNDSYMEISVGFSVRADLAIEDVYFNNNEVTNNSRVEQNKEIRFSTNIKNIKVTGNNFTGESVGNPFFNYQTFARVKGTFNAAKTKILTVEVSYFYVQFSGDPKLSFTDENKIISFSMSDLDINSDKKSYSLKPGGQGKLSVGDYLISYYTKRSHNRYEEYSESINELRITPQTPAYGSVNFLKDQVYQEPEPITVRVQINRETKSEFEKKQASGLASLLIGEFSKIKGVKLLEGVETDKIEQEIELSEAGILNPDSGVDTGKAKEGLTNKPDLNVWIDVELDNQEDPKNVLATLIFNIDGQESVQYSQWEFPKITTKNLTFWANYYASRLR